MSYPFPKPLGRDPASDSLGRQADALEQRAIDPGLNDSDTLWAAAGTYRLAEQMRLMRETLKGLAGRSVSELFFGRKG